MQVRLTPGDEEHGEWVECRISPTGDYLLRLVYKGEPENLFRLCPDEVLRLASLHPAAKRLVRWAKDMVIGGVVHGLASSDGEEALAPFEGRDE